MKEEIELSGATKQLEKEIREAYIFLREKNMTIPSETLEFMYQSSLNALKPSLSPSTVTEMIEALREKEAKYVEWHTNMMINMRGEYDTAPNGEIRLIEQMIQRTAETIRDVREVLSKADKELNK